MLPELLSACVVETPPLVAAAVLRWDVGDEKFDLEHDLSVLYTLVERD